MKLDAFVSVLVAIIGVMGLIVPSLLVHYRELKKEKRELIALAKEREEQLAKATRLNREYEIKISFFDRIMDFTAINSIKESVNRIFKETKADRFLILIAVNGKEDFNIVSVIFEQHKVSKKSYNAIGRYHNVKIDNSYRKLLKRTEQEEEVVIDVSQLEQCLLKDFYSIEKVKHSILRHMARKPLGEDDDFLVYSSLATHDEEAFTRQERTIIKTEYEGVVLPSINDVLD